MITLLLGSVVYLAGYGQQRIRPKGLPPPSSPTDRVALPYYGPVESLVETFIRTGPSVLVKTDTASEMPREEGFVFTSSRKGLITGLGVNLPYAGGVYTVSLWEYDTKKLLKQLPVTIAVAGYGFAFADLEAKSESVPVEANKKYVVSVFIKENSLHRWPYYYLLKSGGNGNAVPFLPFTIGSLTLLNGQVLSSAEPAFPENTVYHMDILSGLCDIRFRATEK